MGSICVKNVRLTKSSQQCPFLGMVWDGYGELLQTSWFQSLCSSVRSWSGNHVPVNLSNKCFSPSDKKEKVSKAQPNSPRFKSC